MMTLERSVPLTSHEALATCITMLALCSLAPSASGQCDQYAVDIISGPPCQLIEPAAGANGINQQGDLCGGYSPCSFSGSGGAVWLGQGGWLNLPIPRGFTSIGPRDINSRRQMAANVGVDESTPGQASFVDFDRGIAISLGTLPGDTGSAALAINENGVICGYSTNSATGPGPRAFIWQNGQMIGLDLPMGPTHTARDISNKGHVCGRMGTIPALGGHAYVWQDGNITDLGNGVPGGIGSEAIGVNDFGHACGTTWFMHPEYTYLRRGTLWKDGQVIDLGVLPGFLSTYPQAINNSGVVIGYCDEFPLSGFSAAFVWQNGVMRKLNDLVPRELQLDIDYVWAMNDAGQIAGQADLLDGSFDTVAVRLTPVPSIPGDFDCSQSVGASDLLGVIAHWGPAFGNGPADFNDDGVVGVADLLFVISNWG